MTKHNNLLGWDKSVQISIVWRYDLLPLIKICSFMPWSVWCIFSILPLSWSLDFYEGVEMCRLELQFNWEFLNRKMAEVRLGFCKQFTVSADFKYSLWFLFGGSLEHIKTPKNSTLHCEAMKWGNDSSVKWSLLVCPHSRVWAQRHLIQQHCREQHKDRRVFSRKPAAFEPKLVSPETAAMHHSEVPA